VLALTAFVVIHARNSYALTAVLDLQYLWDT
jgi:hypothetical protein